MAGKLLKVYYHDRCFDGAASAALVRRFLVDKEPVEATEWIGMSHRQGDAFAGIAIDGDVNVCVDFRYCPDARMHWWFDHHRSAFQPGDLEAHYRARASTQQVFDAEAPSCAGLIARSVLANYSYDLAGLSTNWAELIAWAERTDAANFRSAQEAVSREEPALQLAMWLGRLHDSSQAHPIIEALGARSLAEVCAMPAIAEELPNLLAAHQADIERVTEALVVDGRLCHYELPELGDALPSNFIAYSLAPDCLYSVGLGRTARHVAIAIGVNPWAPGPGPIHNIADICEEFGGGGHARVGGITLEADAWTRAQDIYRQVCERLAE